MTHPRAAPTPPPERVPLRASGPPQAPRTGGAAPSLHHAALCVQLCALALLTACPQARGDRDAQGRCVPTPGQVRVALNALPNTLDWSRSREQSDVNYPVLQAVMRGLTRLEPGTHRPLPDLARGWEVQRTPEGGVVYVFHLRDDVRWSDGVHPLTAEDFVVGWRRALLGYEPGALIDLEGAAEVLAAREALALAPAVREARIHEALGRLGVRALDAHTLEVRLAGPRSHFLSRLATVYVFFPVPAFDLAGLGEAEVQRYFDEPADGRPRVLGRFQVASYDRVAQVLRLTANPSWEGGSGGVVSLTLVHAELASLLYDQCKLDFLFLDDVHALPTVPPAELQREPLLSVYWLGMNTGKLSLPLRRAIAAALDPEALTRGLVPQARVARTLLPPELPGGIAPGSPGTEGFPSFDLQAARTQLAQAPDRAQELTLLVRGGGTFLPEVALADGVRRQLERVGLSVRVVPTSSFTADIRAPDGRVRHHLFLRRTGADYADPQTFFTVFGPGGTHFTEWDRLEGGASLAAFQTELESLAAEEDPGARTAAATRAQHLLLAEHGVAVPLFFPDRHYRRRSHVAGLGVDPFNFLTFRSLALTGASP